MKRTKIKRSYIYTIYKNCQNSAPLFNAQITPKNPRNSYRNCFYVFVDYLANQAFLTPYVLRVLCLFLIVEFTLKVCRSNLDTPCIQNSTHGTHLTLRKRDNVKRSLVPSLTILFSYATALT
jgi:hypothetical protein